MASETNRAKEAEKARADAEDVRKVSRHASPFAPDIPR